VAALADAALGDAGPADDVALLVVRVVPAPLEGRLPDAGRACGCCAGRWPVEAAAGLTPELAEDLELALGEAAANAAEHAYAGREGGEFAYSVARRADGEPRRVGPRPRPGWRPVPQDNGHRGHGLRVIGQIAEDLRIERG
jgi:hypothetical protein